MGCCRHSRPVSRYPPLEESSRRHISSAGKIYVKRRLPVSPTEREDSGSYSSVSGSVSSVVGSNSVDLSSKSKEHELHKMHDDEHEPRPLKRPLRAQPETAERHHDSHSGTAMLTDTDKESVSSSSSELESNSSISSSTRKNEQVNLSNVSRHGTEPKSASPCTSKPCTKRTSTKRSCTARTLVHESDLPTLVEILANSANKWREIGILLGFSPNELKVIASKPSLFENAPVSYLTEMLSRWVQWTPESQHGKHIALCDLVKALQSKTVGLAAIAEEITKAIKGAAKTHQSRKKDSTVTASTHELKPPVPSASVLEHYAYYLRSYFTCNREPADKWPEIEAKEYIRLAVVGNEYNDRTDLAEFREATIHGSIDDILKSKAPFEFNDLLKPNFVKAKEYPIRRLLLEGAPGIGKSTMSWEVCRKWGSGEFFQEYSLVVMLRFRDSWVQMVKSLSDLFRFPGEPEMQQEVAKQIKRMQGKGVLFVLEGFDEAPPSLKKTDSLFFELFKGSLLPNATVMVTTRPSASYDLQRCCKGESSRRIEVLGFGKKEINEYVEAHFRQGTLHVEDFYKYLELYPHIYSMMYVPLNSAIVTRVYQVCKSTSTIVPQTMTQLYTALVKTLLLRYLKEMEEYQDITIKNFGDLPQPVLDKFHRVCKLAFDGITKPKKEIIFSGLPKDFNSLGLMQSVSELYIDEGASMSHNFLHLTIQEFLAAYHLSLLSEDEQVTFLNENFDHQPQMNNFFAGLCEQNPTPVCKTLAKKKQHASFGSWMMYMPELHLCFELHSPHVLTRVFESPKLEFSYGYELEETYCFMSLFDFYVLSYIILFSGCEWKIMLGCEYGNLQRFSKGFSMHQSQVDQTDTEYGPGVIDLVLEGVKYEELARTMHLFPNLQSLHIVSHSCDCPVGSTELLKHLPNSLTSLNLPEMSVFGEEGCRVLGDILASPCHCIECVNINSPTEPDAVQHIIDGVSRNPMSSLEELKMSDLTLSSSNVASLAALLEVNTTLTSLDISRCNLGSHGIICLAKSMEKNTALESLNLSKTVTRYVDCCERLAPSAHANALHCMLLTNKGLVDLKLVNCELHSQDIVLLAEALESNSILQSLNLQENSISDEGAAALAEALKSNSTLESLNLRHNNSISKKGVAAIVKALKINSTLQTLDIRGISSVNEKMRY